MQLLRLGHFLFWTSIFVAVCWVWLNDEIDAAALYPMSTMSAQAGIMVLIGIALYALASGKKVIAV